jgi:septal ring factor EnvC (AmiA/AmiB activator)
MLYIYSGTSLFLDILLIEKQAIAHPFTWRIQVMKKVARDLKAIAKQLNTLAKRTETLAKAFEKAPKAVAKKKPARVAKKKAAPKGKAATPTDQVLAIMKRFKKGISVEALRGKSGFTEKQISNIVHRACQKGKMKRIGRGVYSVFGL